MLLQQSIFTLLLFFSTHVFGYSWVTDLGSTLSAANVNELRQGLNAKRVECGLPEKVWESGPIQSGGLIKADHMEELGVVFEETAQTERNRFRKEDWTDPKILAKITKIHSDHVSQLRKEINKIDCTPFEVQTFSNTDCKTLTCPASHPYVLQAPLQYIQGNDPFLCLVLLKKKPEELGQSIWSRDGDNCNKKGASGTVYCVKRKPLKSETVITKSQVAGGARRFLNCDTEPQSGYCNNPDINFCMNPMVGDEVILDATSPVKKFEFPNFNQLDNRQDPGGQKNAPLNDG